MLLHKYSFTGTHEYSFNYELPKDLPETLDGSRFGTISYAIKGSVYMTLGRVSHSIEEQFYLQSLPDPRVPIPADEDLPKVNFIF